MPRKRKRPQKPTPSAIPAALPDITPDIIIDGSQGEGGGQIVRTALSLSSIFKRSLKLHKIRAGRTVPGLQAQHITSAQTVALIANARIHAASHRSSALFLQRGVQGDVNGTIDAFVPTAGAASLVLQACLPPALVFLKPSERVLVIGGGTTALFAPPSDYVCHVLVPNLRLFGIEMNVTVERHGFFPRGGGKFVVGLDKSRCERVEDTKAFVLKSCELLQRGNIVRVRGVVLMSCAKEYATQLAECVRHAALNALRKYTRTQAEGYPDITEDHISINEVSNSDTMDECISITLYAQTEAGTVLGASAIWSHRDSRKVAQRMSLQPPRKNASTEEKIAFCVATAAQAGTEAAEELLDVFKSGAVVDSHMADQLCVFMAMAKGTSRLLVPEPTLHLTSVVDVIKAFGVNVEIEDVEGSNNRIVVCEGKAVSLRGDV